MFISHAAAQEIVEEIGQEIQENINLMDEHGMIIASTDPSRIGQLHSGALRIISENLTTLSVNDDNENESMKKGINLPLVVHGTVVGVIGITGSLETVSRYGNIVKRMAEIMITDSIRKDTKRYGHRVSYRFLEEWIEASVIPVYEKHFVERGLRLGIDITSHYRIISMSFIEYAELSASLEGQQLIESMEASIRHEAARNDLIYLRIPPHQFLFVKECSGKELMRIADNMTSMIHQKYDQLLVSGLDSAHGQHQNMKQAKQESLSALEYALRTHNSIVSYDDLGIHFILQQLPTAAKIEYIEHFSSRIPEANLDEYLQLINAYFKYNGSLKKISETLFLHKNTLQYKFRKLSEYTGIDIRDTEGSASYLVFLTLYQELYS